MNPSGASYAPTETVYGSFNTRNLDGSPATLSGSPTIAVERVRAGTRTVVSGAGITLSVDTGSVTGKNTYAIDLDDANIVAEEDDLYEVRITAGNVGGTSVVGELVGHFFVVADGLTAAQRADVNAEVDTALGDYGAAQPGDQMDLVNAPNATAVTALQNGLATASALQTVDNEVGAIDAVVDAILEDTGTTLPATLSSMSGAGFNSATDSLEAIRDRGDAAWVGEGGGMSAEDIRTAIGLAAANLDAQLSAIDGAVDTTIPGLIAALNDVSSGDVQAACAAALVAIHLDHLLAADYDPSSKPGVGTALLNEIVENDAGVSRFTANALEAIILQARNEPAAVPAANASLGEKVDWVFTVMRNKVTNSGSAQVVRNAADDASIGSATVTEDGGVVTRGAYS